VYVEVGDQRDLRALFRRADVDGLAGGVHDAGQVLVRERGVHDDLAREEVPRVEAPHLLEAYEALVVDERDVETDLAHVGGDHRRRGTIAGALHGVQVAHRVRLEDVDEALQLCCDDLAYAFFAARHARHFGESLQEIHERESTPRATRSRRRPTPGGTPPARRARTWAPRRARRSAAGRRASPTDRLAPRRPPDPR